MTSPYLDRPRRQLWKALADTGRADYFRWTYQTSDGEIVLSVGKTYRYIDALRHAASPDTCEVMLWRNEGPDRYLMPEDISCLLEPWQKFFSRDLGDPMARHMPDSILTALLFGLGYWFQETSHKAILVNSFRAAS